MPEHTAPTKARVILCIEDEPEMIDLMRVILEGKGFRVVGAEGGLQGLRVLETQTPDAILLDLMMPDVDGWEVFRQVRANARLQGVPVILVTARSQSQDKALGPQLAKVDAYITKPFGPRELVDAVDRAVQAASATNWIATEPSDSGI